MTDNFDTFRKGLSDPADEFFAITPSDSVDMDNKVRAVYVGGAGDISCVNNKGVSVLFVGVSAGSWLPIRTNRVNATGTTATNLVGLY